MTKQNLAERGLVTHKAFVEAAALPKEFLQDVSRLRLFLPVYHVIVTVLLVFGSPLIFWIYPSVVGALATLLLNLHAFHRFSQLVHASDHGDLLPNKWSCEVLGGLCAHFLGFSRAGHAASHHSHHVYLNTDRDPDRVFLREPDPRAESVHGMWRRLLLDLLGVTAVSRFLQYQQRDPKTFDPSPWRRLNWGLLVQAVQLQASVALLQLVMLGYYQLFIGWYWYALLYVLPLFTIYPAQCRLRFFVEHAFEYGYRPTARDEVWITRTTNAPLWERFLFSPLGMPYHFEHHLFPSVPYYQLALVHRYLVEHGFEVPTADGYFNFLWQRWKQERWSGRSASIRPA